MTYDHEKPLDLDDRVGSYVEGLPWVSEAQMRLREQGHIVTGQVYVAPRGDVPDLPPPIADAMRHIDEWTGGCTRWTSSWSRSSPTAQLRPALTRGASRDGQRR